MKTKTIRKYKLTQDFEGLPKGAEILHVGEGHGDLYVWAIVDPSAPIVPRKIEVLGTGWNLGEAEVEFLGTVQMANGLVWHLFDHGEVV